MKKLLIMLLMIVGLTTTTFGQIYNFTAFSLNYKVYNENRDQWSDWMGWLPCNIEVRMDVPQGNIKIFSKHYQSYNIMYKEGQGVFDGDDVTSFYCVDQNGIACRLKLVIRQSGQTEMYVEYKDVKWVYAVRKFQGS